MIKKRFFCPRCEEWVLEPGEAQAKNLRPVPIACPQCGGPLLSDKERQ